MSFNKHVSSAVRGCNFHMSGLRHFRSLVSDEVAHQIACSIVGSRLDYCNSLLLNCSKRNLDKLQRVQNNLARVVCNSSRWTPAEPQYHCRSLSVRQRIDYKLANLCYLAISFHQPVYLAHLIRAHTASRVCYDHQRKVFFPLPRTASTLLVVVYLSRHQYSGLSTTELSDRQTFLRTDFKTFLFSLWQRHCSTRLCTMARYKFIDWLIDWIHCTAQHIW